MPRKKKSSTGKTIMVIVVIAVIAIGIVAWHDGLIGTTTLEDINQGDVDNGTVVTVKGQLVLVVFNILTISDGDGHGVAFTWDGDIPAVDSMVVVTGEVSSPVTLDDVTSVQKVWIFQ